MAETREREKARETTGYESERERGRDGVEKKIRPALDTQGIERETKHTTESERPAL